MRYYKIALLFILVFLGCKSNKYSNDKDLCEILENIYNDDQKYRGMGGQLADPFFKILDSLRTSEGLTKKEYRKLTEKEQLAFGRRAREIANNKNDVSKKLRDSLMMLQKELDIKNTKILIDIVKERGFPDIKKLKCKGYCAPFLIFVHSPEIFWDEIKIIVNEERKNDRMIKGDYDYIIWHMNGRKDSPIAPLSKEDIRVTAD